jgi:hypothetical protein
MIVAATTEPMKPLRTLPCSGALTMPAEDAERAAAPAANPEPAHDAIRLADRRPKTRR